MSEQGANTPKVSEAKQEEQITANVATEAAAKDQLVAEAKPVELSSVEKATDNEKTASEKDIDSKKDESASAVSTTEQVVSSGDNVEKPEERKVVEQPTKVDEPIAVEDKSEEMVTEKIETYPENKTAPATDDSSVEVKMETSTSEAKPTEEKIADVTTTSEPATQPIPPPPSAQQKQPVEEKEIAAEAKPAMTPTNEQPQSQKQADTALPTRQYLDATVVPILHSALSQLAKIRPEDPIQFLCTYLQEYKDSYTSQK